MQYARVSSVRAGFHRPVVQGLWQRAPLAWSPATGRFRLVAFHVRLVLDHHCLMPRRTVDDQRMVGNEWSPLVTNA
jgi:hypothetical protein